MDSANPRKMPKQERSKATVSAIVEAAAQLLVEIGFHKMSTNKIAKRAGVSIGSLYQYFPNKETIVTAVVENFAQEQMLILSEGVAQAAGLPLSDAVKIAIESLIEAKRQNPELNRVLFDELPPLGQLDVYQQWSDAAVALVRLALETREDEVGPQDLDLASFMIVHACHGIIHALVGTRPDLLNNPKTIDEMAELIAGYIGPHDHLNGD